MKVSEIIKSIPMKRWLLANVRLARPTEELMDDGVLATIVAANEVIGRKTGKYDNFGELTEMNIEELTDILKDALDEEPDSEDDEADKSDD